MNSRSISLWWATLLTVTSLVAGNAQSQDGGEPDAARKPRPPDRLDIIKETQNPLTRELGSLALENSFSFGLGPTDDFGYGLLIKPRVPIILSDRWVLITRGSLPVFSVPSPILGETRISGLGDLQLATVLSPATGRRVIWGLGPTVGFPTATDDRLGSGRWLMGPSAVLVYAPRRSVFGIVAQNVWSVDADSSRPKVNALSLRPLVNINLPRGWFITSKPNILADWTASGDDRWLVEAGGGIGRIMRIGNFGITLESQFFGYPVKPDRAPSWATRFTITVTFRRGQLRGRFAAPETTAARE